MTSINEIAKFASVSTATVSRVLNNEPNVKESTRVSVMLAAEKLGYPFERKIQPKPSKCVLMLVREDVVQKDSISEGVVTSEFESHTMYGVQSFFSNINIATRMQRIHMDSPKNEIISQFAGDLSLAGILVMGGVVTKEFVESLQIKNIPVVVVGAPVAGCNVDCIAPDFLQGMNTIIEFLIKLKRRKIALINGLNSTASSIEKLQGYQLALATNGISFDPEIVFESNFSLESGYSITEKLVEKNADIDAIACADDTVALGCIRALKDHGVDIPNDICVTGFYGLDIGKYIDPPLTTMAIDLKNLGISAAMRLYMLMEDQPQFETQTWTIRLPTKLVERRSTKGSEL